MSDFKALAEEKWYGRPEGNECSEHDTLGRRAWCSGCSEYCSPLTPCRGCEMPELRLTAADLLATLEEIAGMGVVFDARGSHSKRVNAIARNAIAKATEARTALARAIPKES